MNIAELKYSTLGHNLKAFAEWFLIIALCLLPSTAFLRVGSIQQSLSTAYVHRLRLLHRCAAGKSYSIGITATMPSIPPLKGEATSGVYVARVDGGTEIDPIEAIFPLLAQEEDGSFRFIGTGFFVAQGAIFLTAAHVVADVDDAAGTHSQPLGVVQFTSEGKHILRSVHVATRNARSDLAVGYLSPLQHHETHEPFPNRVVTLSAASLKQGDEIVTYAYPKTRITSGPIHHLEFEPTYFSGQVVEHWPDGRDASMLPSECYQTTMVIHGGASGGPVFGPDGGVFAINSTGYGDDDVSFVSSVWAALDLEIPSLSFGAGMPPRTTTLRELINLGLVSVK